MRLSGRQNALGIWLYEVIDTKLVKDTRSGAILQLGCRWKAGWLTWTFNFAREVEEKREIVDAFFRVRSMGQL